jgi:putative colanic acid biosynthesis acetyltransferase WcaF
VSVIDKRLALQVDSSANRVAANYSRQELVLRIAWGLGRWLMRLSPRPCFAWRRTVLRLFGARIGAEVRTYPSTWLYMPWNVEIGDWSSLGEDVLIYSLGRVHIGQHVSLSYRAHVCAGSHDLEDPALPLLKPPVHIEAGCWIGTEAYIGPGVTLGQGAIVGARAVVVRDVEPWHIVAGNPARTLRQRVMRSQ